MTAGDICTVAGNSEHCSGGRRGATWIDVAYATLGLKQPAISQIPDKQEGGEDYDDQAGLAIHRWLNVIPSPRQGPRGEDVFHCA